MFFFSILEIIARLHPMLSFPVAEKWINIFVFSRMDYCNALLAGVSIATLNKLQFVKNSAARILTRTRTTDHSYIQSPYAGSLSGFVLNLKFLCLPIRLCIVFGSSIFVRTLQNQNLVRIPYIPTCDLRSSEAGLLAVPPTRLRFMGDKTFSSFAPKLWNFLPSEIRKVKSLPQNVFRVGSYHLIYLTTSHYCILYNLLVFIFVLYIWIYFNFMNAFLLN